ncbi:hypothetical protein [Microbispora sp. H13382]|uniref:hypothetical protein n=1 Tax=Microbispora sp. H13382 TaxID=2729112 RepID=UPI0015FF19F3|nr:hypothetical protein [Microbispora sp. H13382]
MRDPATEDAYEQDGSLSRPYITDEGRHGGEGDRFWSEEHDDQALGTAPEDQGDVLSEDWRPDQPALTPADHADKDDYAAGRTARLRPEGLVSDEEVSDGDTDPRGFLGSGWRNAPDPEGDEAEGSRRGGLLLRTGLIAAGVLGAIWALALWVGQPSGADCADGATCAAGAGTATTAPASPAGEPTDVPTDEVSDVPGDVPSQAPSEPPSARPERTRPATSGTEAPAASPAPSRADRPRTQDPGSRATASPRPSRVSVDAQTGKQVGGTDAGPAEEQAATAPTADAATEQPTSAPAPTKEEPRHGGGLLDWLF